ncbi:uncharacterized protein FIBRA_00926 [Fibroporia radiculosa]|uniref:CNNM transmembrane domain-containing protein n=1 Tax=Fibroporia radiculosa TaxID=599839 RepID=J4H0T7_9APHY|nr:uncharacterized protein FIBRA_00926 [Fibroporia radiculosa]CCL98919.1 predicted protein [Fibroporia radiculosa]
MYVDPVEAGGEQPGSTAFWYKLVISIGLVLAGGVFAGLTLGLMGLDELHLRVLAASSDDPRERQNAQTGSPEFRNFDRIFTGKSSSSLVGSPPPLGACGASCAPIVLGMMYLFGAYFTIVPDTILNLVLEAPIAYPIAKLLDYILGINEAHTYKKAELKSFLAFHRQGEEPLRDDEISILNGVLELNNKHVESIMTPMADVVTISSDKVLDHDTVHYILSSGYSRIPVHRPGRPMAFVGLLLIKKLSVYDPSQCLPVSKFPLSILPEAHPSINCFQALDYFQTGRAHLLLLSNTPGQEGGAIGVVTLEDIIEEIISEEIVDETDRYEDNQSKRRARRLKNATVMRGIVEYRGSRANSQSTLPLPGDRTPLLGGRSIGRDISIPRNGAVEVETVRPTSTLRETGTLAEYGGIATGSPADT